MVLVTAKSQTEEIFYLIGSSNSPSPLCAMILRGSPGSEVIIHDDLFFSKNISESISSPGITESHGILIYDVRIFKLV